MKNSVSKPRMNEYSAAIPRPKSVLSFPTAVEKEVEKPKRSWIFRRFVELGIIAMPNTQTKGWSINPTTITTLIAILLFFGAICGFLWNVAYNQGLKDKENQILMERLEKVEADSKKAKELQLYNDGANEEGKKKGEKEKK